MRTISRISICFLALASFSVYAQEYRATLTGEVTDQTGALVTGAKVVARSVERNIPYDGVTNSSGRYVIQFLLPGKYTLSVEQPGFKSYVREGLVLLASDKAVADIKLEVGAVADSVTVTGDVSALQTESATRQATIENKILEEVPSGGRNLYALEYNEPGVVKTSTYWGSMELYAFGNVNGVAISGGKQGENETVLDGVTNTKSDRGVAFVPNLAATQEFTVQTNSYDAQFGRVGGGVMMINLKSGSNRPHGQLYEFFKNDKFRTGEWNDNANGLDKTPFKNNTFGFEVDGPIFIPKVYDGRNKAFFLISLEGLREHNPGSPVGTNLPQPAQLTGDFSKLFNDSGLVTIYDPLTTVLGADGKTYSRTAFPGNIIPPTRINPVTSKAASYYPAPNRPGVGPMLTSNYEKLLPSTNAYDSWLGKMDYVFSEKSRVSFHYGQTPWLNYSKLVWGNNAAEPSTEWPSTRIPRTWAADWTYTFSPAIVFDLRGGLGRYEGQGGNTFGNNYDPTLLGLPSSLVSQFRRGVFPRFNLNGDYSPIGSSGVFNYQTQDVYSLQPNVSWSRGKHLLHFGAEFRRYNDNSTNPGLASGQYNFDPSWTQANPLQSDANSGNSFATFLLGYPTGGSVDNNVSPAFRANYYALFAQDDFKVTPKLTLNVGLRWDYETPRTERHNQMVRGFAFNQASPIAAAVKAADGASQCPACASGLTGGLLYAGNGGPNYAFEPKKADFQPRIGVAYRFASKLVFRGGYALSYLGQNSNGPQTGYSQTTSLVSSLDGGITPAVTMSDPFPSSIFPTGLQKPLGNSQGLSTSLGQGISFQYLDRPLPYSQQYSAGFQYQLPGSWVLDASYVGNQTKRLPVSLGLNFIPTNVLTSLPVDQRSAYFTQAVTNPMKGLLPGSGFNGATIPLQQLLYAYPQYSGVTMTDVPIGSQRYDGLQTKVSHRLSHGLTMTVSFTASKSLQKLNTLNPQDVNLQNVLSTPLEKHLTQYDIPKQLSVIGSYDLPLGRNRYFGRGMPKWLDVVAGGWTASGAFNSHSGFPIPFPNAAPLGPGTAKWSDSQRDAYARQNGDAQFDVTNDPYFNITKFPTTAQAPYTLRNFPTWFPDVRTKPMNIADVSLQKEFSLKERARLQIRADGHNVGNFPWFSKPVGYTNNVTSSQFGFLENDEENEQRLIVFVMKIVF